MLRDNPLALLPCEVSTIGAGLKTVRLSPDGVVASLNGEFTLDAESGREIVAQFEAHGTPIVVDWEHQSLTGGRAPAAGWIHKVWHERGKGLFGLIEWNAKAAEAIRAKEYLFLSPTFILDRETKRVVALDSAALVNKPAIPRQDALAASRGTQGRETESMDKLQELRTALVKTGATLADGADETAVLACAIERIGKPVSTGADVEIAAAARTILGVPDTATASETVVALSAACVRSLRNELAEKDQQLADQKILDLLTPYLAKGVIQRNTKYEHINADFEDMLKLAKHDWPLCQRILKSRVASLPPQGRTQGPPDPRTNGNRTSVIANASRSFEENPQTAKLTSRRAFVNDALRTASLSALTAEEEKTLAA